MSQQVKVRGLEDLAKALREHDLNVKAGLKVVGLAGAAVLREAMEQRAPVRSGQLRDNIDIGKVEIEKEARVTVPVGPNKKAFYGLFQEKGTPHHAAQPFMRPAADESQGRVMAAAKAAAKKLIADAA